MPHVVGGRLLLSTAEAHARSGLSQRHVSLLAQRGQVEGFKIGHAWLVYADALDRYLDQPRKPGPKSSHRARAVGKHPTT